MKNKNTEQKRKAHSAPDEQLCSLSTKQNRDCPHAVLCVARDIFEILERNRHRIRKKKEKNKRNRKTGETPAGRHHRKPKEQNQHTRNRAYKRSYQRETLQSKGRHGIHRSKRLVEKQKQRRSRKNKRRKEERRHKKSDTDRPIERKRKRPGRNRAKRVCFCINRHIKTIVHHHRCKPRRYHRHHKEKNSKHIEDLKRNRSARKQNREPHANEE